MMSDPIMERPVEAFVEQPRLAVLSTVSATNKPQATVIWYAYEDGAFWFYVERDSRKARNLRANADAALTIDERSWPYKQAVIYGTAVEVPLDTAMAHRVAVRYLGEQEGGAMHDHMISNLDRVGFRLTPQRAYWQDFGG